MFFEPQVGQLVYNRFIFIEKTDVLTCALQFVKSSWKCSAIVISSGYSLLLSQQNNFLHRGTSTSFSLSQLIL